MVPPVLGGEQVASRYYSDENPNGEFDDVDGADVAEAFELLAVRMRGRAGARRCRPVARCDRHRARRGRFSLRWIMVHMIEEYARHNGHADLLRERIDGTVGD